MARHSRNDPERDELWKEFHRLVTMPSPELSDWAVETREGVEIYANEPDVDVRELGEGVSRVIGKRKVDLTPAGEDLRERSIHRTDEPRRRHELLGLRLKLLGLRLQLPISAD